VIALGVHEKGEQRFMLITLLVVLLLLGLLSGGYGHSRGWGYYGWSPLGLLILVVLILALTGNLSF
jgi:high-affinity Fe2+/Pb2+ permease